LTWQDLSVHPLASLPACYALVILSDQESQNGNCRSLFSERHAQDLPHQDAKNNELLRPGVHPEVVGQQQTPSLGNHVVDQLRQENVTCITLAKKSNFIDISLYDE
jgi:hypothetical protein